MEFSGERYIPNVEGDIHLEHMHRYLAVRKIVAGKRVLDIACGEGYGSNILSESAASVVGVDIDAESVVHAQSTYVRQNLRFFQGDATVIPLDDACIDVIVSFETIEHLADHHQLMCEFKRVMVPGGVLVLSSPDRHEYSDVPKFKNPYHVKELYRSELVALLGEYFTCHELYGQRVEYASVLAPTQKGATSFVGFRESTEGGAIEGIGLPAPVYFIAVASDGPPPNLEAGLYVPLSPPYMRDIEFLSKELEAQQRNVAQSKRREEELLGTTEQLRSQIGDLQRKVEVETCEGRIELEAMRLRAIETNQALEGLTQDLARQEQEIRAVQAQEKVLQEKLQAAMSHNADLEAQHSQALRLIDEFRGSDSLVREKLHVAVSQNADLEAQHSQALRLIDAFRSSHSWRITSPLRRCADEMRGVKSSMKIQATRIARALYHSLPVSRSTKQLLKKHMFTTFATFFASSNVYRNWKMANSASEPFAPLVQLYDDDGYYRIRARLDRVREEARAQIAYKPREMHTMANRDPFKDAARIAFPPQHATPEVSVIVPIFNDLTTTLECLSSIALTSTVRSFEVIVADDASTDASRQVLAGIPNLRIVSQERNVGFLRNCNGAAKAARGRRLVFLNNDAQVQPQWLEMLTTALDAPGVGVVGPKIVFPSGALQEAGVRVLREGAVEMIGLGDDPEAPRWSYERDVDYVSGACLMIPTDLFVELGGFDERLEPAYCEDLDLCLRVRERGLGIRYVPATEVTHHLSKSSNALGHGYKHQLISRNMQCLAERHQAAFDRLDDLRVIAFYLPQFHPIPENDLWWGPGFTEWSNVSKAQPNFEGHYQPRLPADLGFYDLRLREVMDAQWALADRYGIDGFCYYYYWFDGHRLLERPLERLLDTDAPAHPFCLSWANENWTRRWDGQDQEILMAQNHSPEDDLGVIRDIARYMRNPAYIRIHGKPLLLIYRADLFPDFSKTAALWREECRRIGIGEIHLAMTESFRFAGKPAPPSDYGCDAAVEFPAHFMPDVRPPSGALLNPDFHGHVANYDDVVVRFATRQHPNYTRYRTVMPGWDNTARRRSNGFILENCSPGSFQLWLEEAIRETKRDLQGENRLLFINAWNEWAEGAYLEPDRKYGHSYLEAVKSAREAAHLVKQPGSSR